MTAAWAGIAMTAQRSGATAQNGPKRWLAARERELLATSYFHVVFTVPHELNVALENPRLFYDLLFTATHSCAYSTATGSRATVCAPSCRHM